MGFWSLPKIRKYGPLFPTIIYVLLNGEEIILLDMRLYTSSRVNPDGSEIPSWLNKPLSELPTRGHIGFQGMHGGVPVRFRNARILELE